MHLYNAFARAATKAATYRIRGNFRSANPVNLITAVTATAFTEYPIGLLTPFTSLATNPASADGVGGLDETVLVPAGYIHLVIGFAFPLSVGQVYAKNIRIDYVEKAEIQDSNIFNAGNLRSFYEGTKISSTDINVDSPDTIDGGPVITVNTVSPSTPSSNPIGTSVVVGNTALEGRAIVNRSPSSNVS